MQSLVLRDDGLGPGQDVLGGGQIREILLLKAVTPVNAVGVDQIVQRMPGGLIDALRAERAHPAEDLLKSLRAAQLGCEALDLNLRILPGIPAEPLDALVPAPQAQGAGPSDDPVHGSLVSFLGRESLGDDAFSPPNICSIGDWPAAGSLVHSGRSGQARYSTSNRLRAGPCP